MIKRFEGEAGMRFLVEALQNNKMVKGDIEIAQELAKRIKLEELSVGDELIQQDSETNDIYFVISGSLIIIVNGRQIAIRGPNDHIGEMAAIQPTQKRSATVQAVEQCLVAKITESDFAHLAKHNAELYRSIAQELARRLMERNKLVTTHHEQIRVFIISSVEALEIARAIQTAFEHEKFTCTVWTDGVFRATSYSVDALEEAIDHSDFAIAIAHADDVASIRGQDWPSPRDNVIFELGLFMGRLGRSRAILMEPRDGKVKLPSDMAGITTIPYRFEVGEDMHALIAPACNKLREHIKGLGPYNG